MYPCTLSPAERVDALKDHAELAAVVQRLLRQRKQKIPHCPELNEPGEVGCVCLDCVRAGRQKLDAAAHAGA